MRHHDRGVYRELLRQFRDGFAKYSGTVFCLEALTPQEERELDEWHRRSIIDCVGTVNSPEGCVHVYAAVGGLVNYPDEATYARQVQICRDAWQFFRPLAERAGSHLPPAVRDSLPAEPGTAISSWLNVLYWHLLPNVDVDGEGNGGATVQKRRLLSYSPFQHSAMAIEHLGLATKAKPIKACRQITAVPPDPAAGGNDYFTVTLQQIAPLVNRQKRTLERWSADENFPLPDVEGGGGKAHEWKWSRIRPYLEKKTRRKLPERHPADTSRPDFGALED